VVFVKERGKITTKHATDNPVAFISIMTKKNIYDTLKRKENKEIYKIKWLMKGEKFCTEK